MFKKMKNLKINGNIKLSPKLSPKQSPNSTTSSPLILPLTPNTQKEAIKNLCYAPPCAPTLPRKVLPKKLKELKLNP
jgi:hypothetical protein